MWYTIIIVIDLFLIWFITNGIITCISYLIGIDLLLNFHNILELIPIVPNGFKMLFFYVPNVFLFGLYFMFLNFSQFNAFKFWYGWSYIRNTHFSLKTYEIDTNETILIEVETHWKPPHQYGKQILYAVCPHGVYAEVVIFCFTLNRVFEEVTTIATSLLFWIPILREFACIAGAMPANTSTICSQLDHGKSIILLPEGLRGVLHPHGTINVLRGIPGENEPRKGFIRCALSSKNHNNLFIVPVYTKGVNDLYQLYLPFPWLQKRLLSNFYYPFPLISIGWYGTFFPKSKQIKICYGRKISLVDSFGHLKEVDQIHEEYCQNVEELIKLSKKI